MRLTDGSRRARVVLVVDLVALATFVLVGMRLHRSGDALVVFARTAVPVIGAWLVCAVVFGTYRPPAWRRLVPTILVGVTAGVALRTAIVGSPEGWRILQFLVVALVFVTAFVAAGRVLSALLTRRSEEPA